jgi:predicted DNA-binding transcriptional regulator AlpA
MAEPSLRLHDSPSSTPNLEAHTSAAVLTALLLPAPEASRLCSVSEATWWRLHASAKIPRPVRLGKRTLWRAEELRAWIAAGIPDRRTWEAMQAARR